MKVINIIPYLNQTLCSGQYTIDCSIESFEGFAVKAKYNSAVWSNIYTV